MTNQDREMILSVVADGDINQLGPIVYQLYNYTRYMEMFQWLLSNKITGDRVWTLFLECHCSPYTLAVKILRQVEKNKAKDKILYGIDYRG